MKSSAMINRIILVSIFIFTACCVCPSAASAQLSMSPIIIEMEAYPGSLKTFSVSLGNNGKVGLDSKMTAHPMSVEGAGMPVIVKESPRSCSDWVTFETEQFRLGPGSGKKVICRLRTPKGVKGSYFALIACHGVPEDSSETSPETKASVRFSFKTMAVLIVTVPGSGVRSIVEPGVPMIETGRDKGGFALKVPVRNRGTLHTKIHGNAEIRSEAGQLIEQYELQAGRGFLLPDHERLFTQRSEITLPDGAYQARVTLQEEQKSPMKAAFPFVVIDGKPEMRKIDDALRAELEAKSSGFIVATPHLNVDLRPGAQRTQAVEIANMTNKDIRLMAGIGDWLRDQDGNDLVIPGGAAHGRSARDWISLRASSITLRPRSRTRVPITIAAPKETGGESYAALTFDRADRKLDPSPQQRVKRSALIRVGVKGQAQSGAKVKSFQAERESNGVTGFRIDLLNTGDLSIVPELTVTIRDSDNQFIGKTKVECSSFIQAGGEAIFKGEWKEVLNPGAYSAELSCRYDANKPPLVERSQFVVGKMASFVH